MKESFQLLGVLVGLLLFGFVVSVVLTVFGLVTLPWTKFVSKVNMNREIITKTYDADNAIYNYEWFKNRYESIQATDKKIANAQASVTAFESSAGDRSAWTFEDKTEYSRLQAVVLGLKNQKEDLVAEYNARAKMVNRNIFQDSLPLFIDLN